MGEEVEGVGVGNRGLYHCAVPVMRSLASFSRPVFEVPAIISGTSPPSGVWCRSKQVRVADWSESPNSPVHCR